jgi:hypothetical protein
LLKNVSVTLHWQVHPNAPRGTSCSFAATVDTQACPFIHGVCCQQSQQGIILPKLVPPAAEHVNSGCQGFAYKLAGLKAIQRLGAPAARDDSRSTPAQAEFQ